MLWKYVQGAGGNAAKAQPSFVSQSINRAGSSTTNTVTAPTGIQDGYLLVAYGVCNTASVTITPPTGFNVQYLEGTTVTMFVASKVASSESGNYTWTWSSSVSGTIAMLVYKDASVINTIGAVARTSATTGTASSITPTYAGTLIAAFSNGASSTIGTAPSGMTLRSSQTAAAQSVGIYDLSNQAASSTGTKDIIWNSSGTLSSILFQITNESTGIAPEFVAVANTQNTASGSSLVISKPTGTAQDDLMIAVMSAGGQSSTWTGDTGWTEVADNGNSPDLRVAYKVAGASEGSSYTFTFGSSATTLAGSILTYRYGTYDTISSITFGNPLVTSSINTAASQSLLFLFATRAAASITLTLPASMTSRVLDNDITAPSYRVCDQVVANGATGQRSVTTGSATNTNGIVLSIKPTRTAT